MNWVSIREAARAVNRTPRTIYNWIGHGRIRTRIDERGLTLVDARSLLDAEATVKRGRPRGSARPRALYSDTPRTR